MVARGRLCVKYDPIEGHDAGDQGRLVNMVRMGGQELVVS
jgi:hypothetical protein